MDIVYCPIGIVHTPFKKTEGMPIQPLGAAGVAGSIEILPEFAPGLQDIDGFSHLILLYHFHRVEGFQLVVTPFLDSQPHGLFATRAPARPNPIGLSIVKLVGREGNMLRIENVDLLDGTPLLDIKPYVPEFDQHPAERVGWLEQAKGQVHSKKSDKRFG